MSLKNRKLSNKEKFDIDTALLFKHSAYKDTRIYPNDKKKFADLSSKGIKPKRITRGYEAIINAKMWRDLQITEYKKDIKAGLFIKSEIVESFSPRFRQWIWNKIKDVPHDINGNTEKLTIRSIRCLK